jgi:hypothetical protein
MKKNMKMTIALSALLLFAMLSPILIMDANALKPKGKAWVHWAGATTPTWISTKTIDNDLMLMKNWTWMEYPFSSRINITFTVTNYLPTDPSTNIFKVYLHFVEEGVSNAKFQALRVFEPMRGSSKIPTWVPTLSDPDMKGWPRFANWETTDPGEFIGPGEALNFTVEFGNKYGQVNEEDEYAFTVTSSKVSDTGTTFELQDIILAFDTTPPTVVNITITPLPDANNVTTGQLLPFCGRHRFNVTFSAKDKWGLWKWEMAMYNTTTGNLIPPTPLNPNPRSGFYDPNPPKNETAPNKTVTRIESWIDYKDGSYTVKVKVWDLVGNVQDPPPSKSFKYKRPAKPFTVSPETGYAAIDTWLNTTTGLVYSKQVVYGTVPKTFGTLVTASGYNYAPSGTITDVTIKVYIDTYPQKWVAVSKTKTNTNGTFTTTFIFPKAPAGIYNVSATSTYYYCTTTFEVKPQVIFKPNEVIGPALINVEATGFMKPDTIPITNRLYLLCNNKDSLMGTNNQVLLYWYFDGNGTLQNKLTFDTGRLIDNGIFWPSMQPGTYNITLFLFTPGKYWRLDHWEARTSFEHNNTIKVIETLSLLVGIKSDTAAIKLKTDTINWADIAAVKTKTDTIIWTDVTAVKTKTDTINWADVTAIKLKTDGITWADITAIKTKTDTINWADVTAVKTKTDTINWADVTAIELKTAAIELKTDTINWPDVAQMPNLTTPIYIAAILSLIAAIAAIACAIGVYRKIA